MRFPASVLPYVLSLPLLLSCLKNDDACVDGTALLRIHCTTVDEAVKSGFGIGESTVFNWCAMAYDRRGRLCGVLSSDDGGDMALPGNNLYRIYAVGNMAGTFLAPATEAELMEYRCSADVLSMQESGFPMSGGSFGYIAVEEGVNEIEIVLERAVAKYNLLIDSSELHFSSLELTSVAVKQSASDVLLFGRGSVPLEVSDCDYATEADIEELNAGREVSFYMLENCGGVLLKNNRDQWKKVPDSLGTERGKLTYLELKGRWLSSGISSDITLRMYLGRDNCSDFNIDRNTVNTVLLSLSDKGLLESDWRISRSNINDDRILEFTEKEIEVVSGSEAVFVGVNCQPADVEYSISVNDKEIAEAEISYETDNTGIYISSDYRGEGTKSALFRLKTWDGVEKGSLKVNVRKKTPYDIGGLESTYVLTANSLRWPDVVFFGQVPSRAMLGFGSSDESVAKFVWDSDDDENPLGIKTIGPGFAALTITYGTFEKKVYVYVTKDYSLVGLPDRYLVLDQGETKEYLVSGSSYSVIPGVFDVKIEDRDIVEIVSETRGVVKNFSINGINFGNLEKNLSFSLRGAANGRTRLTCSTDYPNRQLALNAYVIGPGRTASFRLSPSNGSVTTTLYAKEGDVSYNADNKREYRIQIAGDAVVTAVKFSRSESVAYHSDLSLSERCNVSLCGKKYAVGQIITDLDDLNGGEPFVVRGFDSIIELQVSIGHSEKPSTLKIFFTND